jgi:hypothetical protein
MEPIAGVTPPGRAPARKRPVCISEGGIGVYHFRGKWICLPWTGEPALVSDLVAAAIAEGAIKAPPAPPEPCSSVQLALGFFDATA